MVTYFNKKDLVDFGNYLLSDERKKRFENYPEEANMPPLEDRLKFVTREDIVRFLDSKKKID